MYTIVHIYICIYALHIYIDEFYDAKLKLRIRVYCTYIHIVIWNILHTMRLVVHQRKWTVNFTKGIHKRISCMRGCMYV